MEGPMNRNGMENATKSFPEGILIFVFRTLLYLPIFLLLTVIAYYKVYVNGAGDHLSRYRFIDSLLSGEETLFVIGRAPRYFPDAFVGMLAYPFVGDDPYLLIFVITMMIIAFFLYGLHVFVSRVTAPMIGYIESLSAITICVALLYLSGNFSFWTQVASPSHHGSAMAMSLICLAIAWKMRDRIAAFSLLSLTVKEIGIGILAFLAVCMSVASDEIFVIWGLAPAFSFAGIAILFGSASLLSKARNMAFLFVLFASCIFGAKAFEFVLVEWVLPVVPAEFKSISIDKNIRRFMSGNINLIALLNPVSTGLLVAGIAVSLVAVLACLAKRNDPRSRSLIELKPETILWFVMLGASSFALSLFGMILSRLLKSRYLDFPNMLITIFFAIAVAILFRLGLNFAKVKAAKIAPLVLAGVAVGVSALTVMPAWNSESRPSHKHQANADWLAQFLDDAIPDEDQYYGVANYWLAHEITHLQDKIEMRPLRTGLHRRTGTFNLNLKWDNLMRYFEFDADQSCWKTKKFTFMVDDIGFGEEAVVKALGPYDKKLCSENDKVCAYSYPEGMSSSLTVTAAEIVMDVGKNEICPAE